MKAMSTMDLVAPAAAATTAAEPAPSAPPTSNPAPAAASADAGDAPPTGIAFKPVGNEGEVQPGGTLMVEAYAAIWIIVLGFVLVSFMRTRGLAERVQSLEAAMGRLDAARAKAASPAKATKPSPAIAPDAAKAAED